MCTQYDDPLKEENLTLAIQLQNQKTISRQYQQICEDLTETKKKLEFKIKGLETKQKQERQKYFKLKTQCQRLIKINKNLQELKIVSRESQVIQPKQQEFELLSQNENLKKKLRESQNKVQSLSKEVDLMKIRLEEHHQTLSIQYQHLSNQEVNFINTISHLKFQNQTLQIKMDNEVQNYKKKCESMIKIIQTFDKTNNSPIKQYQRTNISLQNISKNNLSIDDDQYAMDLCIPSYQRHHRDFFKIMTTHYKNLPLQNQVSFLNSLSAFSQDKLNTLFFERTFDYY